MEANIQIKSAKVEGNKVTDLEFYGDWIAELGGSGPSYIDCHMSAISANTLPKNIFTVTTGTWTNGQHSITLKLQISETINSMLGLFFFAISTIFEDISIPVTSNPLAYI